MHGVINTQLHQSELLLSINHLKSYSVFTIWLNKYFPISSKRSTFSSILSSSHYIKLQQPNVEKLTFFPPFCLLCLCHAHFKIYFFFQSDGLYLKAEHCPPALSQRSAAKTAMGKFSTVSTEMRQTDDHCYFFENGILFKISFRRTEKWKKKRLI